MAWWHDDHPMQLEHPVVWGTDPVDSIWDLEVHGKPWGVI